MTGLVLLSGVGLFQIMRTASNATPGMESFGGALWLDGLRGPRPKSVQWPLAKERNSSDVPQPRGRWRQPQPLKGGRVPRQANPDEAMEAARVRATARVSVGRFGRVRFC